VSRDRLICYSSSGRHRAARLFFPLHSGPWGLLMKKTLISLVALAAIAALGAGCAKNACKDDCAGGGAACKAKEAAGGTCCGKCPGPNGTGPAKPAN
jgi:hypothetical protein